MPEDAKVHVGNLSYGVNEDDIRCKFEKYGVVEDVNIITDRDTARPKGFGFVMFQSVEDAEAAIKGLNQTDLDGRDITVDKARPRGEGGSRNFRGGGGGGGGRYGGGGYGGGGYGGGRGGHQRNDGGGRGGHQRNDGGGRYGGGGHSYGGGGRSYGDGHRNYPPSGGGRRQNDDNERSGDRSYRSRNDGNGGGGYGGY